MRIRASKFYFRKFLGSVFVAYLLIITMLLAFRLRDNVEELRHSLQPKESALEALQQSLLEKDQVRVSMDLFEETQNDLPVSRSIFAYIFF